MPYIRVSLSKRFTDDQAVRAKTELGKRITILPGKDESRLMLEFCHSPHMFFRGDGLENGAFLDCRLFGSQTSEAKKQFTEAVFVVLKDVFAIAPADVFMSYTQYEDWGSGGTLKTL